MKDKEIVVCEKLKKFLLNDVHPHLRYVKFDKNSRLGLRWNSGDGIAIFEMPPGKYCFRFNEEFIGNEYRVLSVPYVIFCLKFSREKWNGIDRDMSVPYVIRSGSSDGTATLDASGLVNTFDANGHSPSDFYYFDNNIYMYFSTEPISLNSQLYLSPFPNQDYGQLCLNTNDIFGRESEGINKFLKDYYSHVCELFFCNKFNYDYSDTYIEYKDLDLAIKNLDDWENKSKEGDFALGGKWRDTGFNFKKLINLYALNGEILYSELTGI